MLWCFLLGLFCMVMCFLPDIVKVISAKTQPKVLSGTDEFGYRKDYDPHFLRQTELEVFGQEWVDEFGTSCDCGACWREKYPAAKMNLAQAINEQRRVSLPPRKTKIIKRGRYNIVIPEGVPDYAESYIEYWPDMRTGQAIFKWTDRVTGERRYKTAFVMPSDLAPSIGSQRGYK